MQTYEKCPECGSEKSRKLGCAITREGKKQMRQCTMCGRNWRGEVVK